MGGLTAERNFPAARYDFEMLHAETGEPFLHFKVHRASRAIPRFFSTKELAGKFVCDVFGR